MESCKNDFLCTLPDKLWYRERVDDVAVLGNFITALLAEKMKLTTFFFNKSNLKEYQSETQNRKSCVPGSAALKKFYDSSMPIKKLVSSLWSTCTVTALPQPLNVARFVLTKDGQVLCPQNVFPNLCRTLTDFDW